MSNKVLVETSARHVHLTEDALTALFGAGVTLSNKKDLSQPGQFASAERVDVVGPKGSLKGVTIIGPCRKATQIEVSATDARVLGVTPPVRESGDVKGSAPCKLVGPAGEVELSEGIIIAKRHVHCDLETAKELGLNDGEIVCVKILSADRSLIFDDVVCRVNKNYAYAMHIDVDEANASGCTPDTYGEILKK